MPYVWSLVLLIVGLLVLGLFLARMYRDLRRFRAVRERVADDFADRGGHLTARAAGVRVGLAERLSPRYGSMSAARTITDTGKLTKGVD